MKNNSKSQSFNVRMDKELIERIDARLDASCARNQFRIATELAKIGIIVADNLNVPKEQLANWHVQALNEVKRINGVLGFEERMEG